VEVSAARTSANYTAPDPVRGLVQIGFPSWQVRVPPVGTVRWSSLAGGRLSVTVFEDSGEAFGVTVEGSDDNCAYVSTSPSSPSPVGTTRYTAVLELAQPTADGYSCELSAVGTPLDYAGGRSTASFSITVVP
jgi:hypothetical protein